MSNDDPLTLKFPTPSHTIQICDNAIPLVTIHTDTGVIEYGEGYTPDRAARTFWEAVSNFFKFDTERMAAALEEVQEVARKGLGR